MMPLGARPMPEIASRPTSATGRPLLAPRTAEATGARPARVMHLIDTLRPGGAEHLLLTTVKHLAPARFQSIVVALSSPVDLEPDLECAGASVHVLGARRPLDGWRQILPLARLLRQYRVDILHTHLRFSNLYGRLAAILARTPAVVTSFHQPDYAYWPPTRWRQKLWMLADRLTAQRVNAAFIAVSRAVRDDYAQQFKLDGVRVIYNYLDPRQFPPSSSAAASASRREFGWTGGEFVILNVARLAQEKGQCHLLRAMFEIVRAAPEARLLLVGDGPDDAALRTICRDLGIEARVVFTGNRRDISALLAMSDVFVFPSLCEGFGIALIEAMTAERAVVASRTGGIVELLEEGGGLLIPPGDAAAICEAVLRLRDDPILRARLGQQAHEVVSRRFSVDVGIPALEAVYQQVLPRLSSRSVS